MRSEFKSGGFQNRFTYAELPGLIGDRMRCNYTELDRYGVSGIDRSG